MLKEKKEIVAGAILTACQKLNYAVEKEEILESIIEAKPEFGDFASTIAFSIAKREKKNPNEIAEAIAKGVKIVKEMKEVVEKATTVGGYINFTHSNKFFTNSLKEITAKKEKFGKGETKEKKVIVDYIGVNPIHPWHIGHLRNALLGDSISNILEFSGYNVERANFINDLGLQAAQAVWGHLTLPEPKGEAGEKEKFDHLLGKQYVEIASKGEATDQEVRNLLKKLEKRDPSVSKRAREICENCVQAQFQTAFSYNLYQDVLIWESDILESKLFEKGLSKLLKSEIFEKVEEGELKGCTIIKLEESEFPSVKSEDKVIIRSDGIATYTAKDVMFAMWKFGLLDHKFKYKVFLRQPNKKSLYTTTNKGKEMPFGKADIAVNVIGMEQSYLQGLVKYTLKKMGYEQAENYIHISYEHVVLPEGRFRGRLGTWIGYTSDELVEEGIKRAKVEIEKRLEKSGIKGKEAEKVAKMVGVGAIKFSVLKPSPNKQITFDWDRALSFAGAAAPYVQYAYVRARRIMEKGEGIKPKVLKDYTFNENERKLIQKLSQFPEIVEKSTRDFQSYYLADYVLDVADLFNKFYETTPVIKAEEKEKQVRLATVESTATVLKTALGLLGIEVPEKM